MNEILARSGHRGETLARCGYRCDLCLAYRPNVEADPSAPQVLSDGWHKYFGFRIRAEKIVCDGCLSESPQTLDVGCPVRPCATERGCVTCAECPEYDCGCEKLAGRLVVYETLAATIPHPIPEEDRTRFIAPYENKDRLDGLQRRRRQTMGKHFVLIHGAWHGGWCWDGVIAELQKAGHTAEAPTMPGHAPGDDRSKVGFDDYVQAIVDVMQRQPEPAVLVGHSSAGFLLQSAAPKVADRIAQLVFLNAFVLPNDTCQFDLVPPEASEGMTAAAKASPDNSVPVVEDFVRGALMATEPVEQQNALLERLVPQPLALFTTRIDETAFQGLSVPKAVVFCREDASLPPGAFVGMAQGLGEHRFIEIEGSHEALYTCPAVVAEGLLEAVGLQAH